MRVLRVIDTHVAQGLGVDRAVFQDPKQQVLSMDATMQLVF